MKKFLIILTVCFSTLFAKAQTNDTLIFDAMKTELERSVQGLKMPNMPSPFFINYLVSEGESIHITATMGGIVSSRYQPMVRGFLGRVMTESNALTNDAQYSNQGTVQVNLPIDNNINQLRRDIWLATDRDYKKSLESLTAKKNALRKLNRTDAEKALLDYEPASPVELLKPAVYPTKIDPKVLENLCETLSAQFLNYPKLYNSEIQLIAYQSVFYNMTSEGTKTKQPLSHVVIKISANVRADDGAVLYDYHSVVASDLSTLPTLADLLTEVNTFAADLQNMGAAEPVKEYYSGPVLFENEAVRGMFLNNLLSWNALYANRKPIISDQNRYDGFRNVPIGRKLIDTRLTIINHTQMTDYQGEKLVGAYSVDAEGIVPAASQVLVEKGMMKNFLNNRIPTEFAPKSNGNQRIGTIPGRITTDVKPAVLEIQVSDGQSLTEMRQRLITSAKEEGLTYAYIVRRAWGSGEIYRIDVETGQETLMRSPSIEYIEMKRLKRLDAISSDMQVANLLYYNQMDVRSHAEAFPLSVICPKAVLLQDVEIQSSTENLEVKPAITNPLERSQTPTNRENKRKNHKK